MVLALLVTVVPGAVVRDRHRVCHLREEGTRGLWCGHIAALLLLDPRLTQHACLILRLQMILMALINEALVVAPR